jgi:hypothetical protein
VALGSVFVCCCVFAILTISLPDTPRGVCCLSQREKKGRCALRHYARLPPCTAAPPPPRPAPLRTQRQHIRVLGSSGTSPLLPDGFTGLVLI